MRVSGTAVVSSTSCMGPLIEKERVVRIAGKRRWRWIGSKLVVRGR